MNSITARRPTRITSYNVCYTKLLRIAWHTRHILQHGNRERPLVLFGQHKTRGGSEVFIYCRDMPNLFATVAANLNHKNLDIHDAQIMNSKDGFVMDTFVVLEPNGDPVEPNRIPLIASELEQALSNSYNFV